MVRDDFARHLELDRLSAVMVLAAGGQVDIPEYATELARFEQLLDEPPAVLDRVAQSRMAVRTALGLSAVPANA